MRRGSCEPLIALYRLTPPAAAQARAMIRVLSVTVVGTAYQSVCLSGLIRSGGDAPFVLRTDASLVLLLLPAAWFAMQLQAPPFLVYACLKSDQLLKCPIAAVKVNRFHWVRRLTRSPTA